MPGKRSENYDSYDLAGLDVDYAVACQNMFPTVIMQKGNIVIKVTFYQTSQSYTMQLNDWAQIFATSIK